MSVEASFGHLGELSIEAKRMPRMRVSHLPSKRFLVVGLIVSFYHKEHEGHEVRMHDTTATRAQIFTANQACPRSHCEVPKHARAIFGA
jgi:hypothetical protein